MKNRRILNKLLLLAGKKDFIIDDNISYLYLINLCIRYAKMAIRGEIKSVLNKNIQKCFIGKKVTFFENNNIHIGTNTKIHNNVKIDALSIEGVHIGENVVIGEGTKIECTGSLSYIGRGVIIGNNSSFGNDCFFGAAGGIEIGADVVAGQFIRFHSENHNYDNINIPIKNQGVSHKGIKIGNNCWIGSGAVFLDGAELGSGCVVAANAVVTKKFANNAVIGGVPARVIKYRGE